MSYTTNPANQEKATKKLFLIGGTMGVGKTLTCRILNKKLHHCVFLDGDWCWYSDPLRVTNETKKIVIDNITHTLNNFIECDAYDNIVFCWILNSKSVINAITSRLKLDNCRVISISLICNEGSLKARVAKDIKIGKRDKTTLSQSLALLSDYAKLDTVKINTSNISAKEVAEIISNY